MKISICFFLTLFLFSASYGGEQNLNFKDLTASSSLDPENYKMGPDKQLTSEQSVSYYYQYFDRYHSFGSNMLNIGAVYGFSWMIYPLFQHNDFQSGSWEEYKTNFGQLVFDQDQPYWNWLVHPLTGSQLYLFYRSTGYSRVDSLGMTFISSALWEFTVEVWSEPASIQDLYQTPVLGSLLGLGLESLSMFLLNQDNPMSNFFGYLFNFYTLFWWYDGKIQVVPSYYKKTGTVTIMGTF